MILDDQYITKDMFTQDSYRGNYYANKNAVMFDLQNGKQNVVCFCDNKFNPSTIPCAVYVLSQKQTTFCFPFCKSYITAFLFA